MSQTLIAFDFSMSKPAMCAVINGKMSFDVWPAEMSEKDAAILEACGVTVSPRGLEPLSTKNFNEHTLILEHVRRASALAETICGRIGDLLRDAGIESYEDVYVANEGFAFGSAGTATLDLSGYKYILMDRLIASGFRLFRTYAPIQIKHTAGCAKKGMGKDDMILAMGAQRCTHPIMRMLADNPQALRKKTNFMKCVDDIADSYWCLRTLMEREAACSGANICGA